MRKMLIGGFAGLFLIGCAAPKYETKVLRSNFDNSTSKMSTRGTLTCKQYEECPVLSAVWIDKQPDNIRFNIEINSPIKYYNITRLSFNIDGEIMEITTHLITDHNYNDLIKFKTSKNTFIAPKSILDKISNAKKIWVKVEILSDGSLERAMLENGIESNAFKAIKAFKID